MLQGALLKVPGIYNWLAWWYGAASPLICQGKQLVPSSTGVHQGDAMGPLGFTLGLDVALDRAMSPDDMFPWNTWYLDDGTIVAPLNAICDYLERLMPALRSVGLEINLAKCALWGPGIQRECDPCDTLPEELPVGHPVRSIPVIPYGPQSGITVLGTPCDAGGSHHHGRSRWSAAVESTLA